MRETIEEKYSKDFKIEEIIKYRSPLDENVIAKTTADITFWEEQMEEINTNNHSNRAWIVENWLYYQDQTYINFLISLFWNNSFC